jgi:hypothetical protein
MKNLRNEGCVYLYGNKIYKGSVTMKEAKLGTEQNRFDEFLYKHLAKELFASGSELKALLVKRFDLSNDYARQIVSRAAKNKVLKSSSPYTFGKNQFIYFSNEETIDAAKIRRVCYKSRPPLYRLITVLEQRGGILSFYEAMKITASPCNGSSTKVATLEDILKVLKKLNIAYEKKDHAGGRYIILFPYPGEPYGEMIEQGMINNAYAHMVTDASLIPDILRWLNRCNLISTEKAPIYRNKKSPSIGAIHNQLWWDAFSYTKSTGINPILGAKAEGVDKQTLVVLDVVLSETYTVTNLDGFYSRVQINLNSTTTGVRKVMPIIIYRTCDEEAQNKINKLGFIAFEIGAIFGNKIYEVLQQFQEINELIAFGSNGIDRTVKDILKTIRQAGQDDALKDLKGTLFECLMYPVLKSMYPDARIERGRVLTERLDDNPKVEYEYDFIIHSQFPPETVFVELKGYMSNATISLGDPDKKGSLKWFFERTLPFGKKILRKESEEGRSVKGVYLTTAKFWEDGRKYVEQQNLGRYKSLKANTGYERSSLIEFLGNMGFKKELAIIKKFYTAEEDLETKKKPIKKRKIMDDLSQDN